MVFARECPGQRWAVTGGEVRGSFFCHRFPHSHSQRLSTGKKDGKNGCCLGPGSETKKIGFNSLEIFWLLAFKRDYN